MGIETNERELVSWLIIEANEIIKKNKNYPFKEVTGEVSLSKEGETVRFPDAVLWKNRQTKQSIAFLELKRPNEKENPKTFSEKFDRLNVKYAITWDFLNAYIWTKDNFQLIELKKYPTYCFSNINEAIAEPVKEKIKFHLKVLFNDISQLHNDGHLHDFIPDKTFFIQLLRNAVSSFTPMYADLLQKKRSNKELDIEIRKWAVSQGIANPNNDWFNEMLSNQLVYRLIGRIIFYLTLKRHFKKQLPELLPEENVISIEQFLKMAFAEARKIDYQAVFEEDITEKIGFPQEGHHLLYSLLIELNQYNFSQLKEDVIGEIFEELIPQDKRHSLGQYFTREDLVDFITAFVVKNKDDYCLDPTCGSGTFLNRVYSRLRHLSGYTISHSELLTQIWGVDIAHFPAELATINLFRHNISDYGNFPKIIVRDFFDVIPGQSVEFPPPKVTNLSYNKVSIPFPMFDGIVGNFPYIRQELIEKQIKNYKKFLTLRLAEKWLKEYPEVFTIDKQILLDLQHINGHEQTIQKGIENGRIKLNLSGQADIYAYLFFHSAQFLKPGARIGVVVSNSWLDVAYGLELKKFLLTKFKIITIAGSWVEPWFDDASVNTVFVILERSDDIIENSNHKARFVKIKKKLKDLIGFTDLKIDEIKRWAKLDALTSGIESASKEIYKFDKTVKYREISKIESYEDSDFRIRMVSQKVLIEEIEEKKTLAKWGKYLRAPDIYFEIIDKAKDKLVPLRKIADVRFGIKTGINDFFYFTPEKIEKWKIEEEFLKTVIKSPKEANCIEINPLKLKLKLFMCNKSKEELRKEGKIGALKYIEDGEERRTKDGVPYTEVQSVKGRKYWYAIEEREPGIILLQMINNESFRVFFNSNNIQVDHNLFELLIKKQDMKTTQKLVLLLNSTLFALIREVYSRVNLGDGATKTEGIDWKDILCPDINCFTVDVNSIFDKFKSRPIKSIFKEIKQQDRRELDSLVLKTIGLDPEKYLDDLYSAITELVNERLELPKMRKKSQNNQSKIDADAIIRHVVAEIIPDGVKQFPDAYTSDKDFLDCNEYGYNGKELSIGPDFFGKHDVIVNGNSAIVQGLSLFQAKFVVYSAKKDNYILRLPKSKKKVETAVKEYEKYIREIREKLINRFYEATHSHNQSASLAGNVMEEYNLRQL